MDVVATNNSETAYEVVWYEAPVEPTGSWTKHNIDVEWVGGDGVDIYDIDGDGSPDVVAAEYENDVIAWHRVEWESYKSGYFLDGEVSNIFSNGTENTICMYGTGFTPGTYKVIYWEGTTAERQVDVQSAQNGAIMSHYTFAEGVENPGTWYNGVYDADYDPSSYAVGLIWGDTFEVEAGAIPEFPTVITAIVVLGLCFGIYYLMRKRMMVYSKDLKSSTPLIGCFGLLIIFAIFCTRVI